MSNARNLANLLNTSGEVESNKLDDNAVHGRRSMTINGAMQLWQRGTGPLSGTNYLADRFKLNETSDGVVTQERDTDAPNGFPYSLELNVTTVDSTPSSTDIVNIAHSIEGQDLQSLKYGTTDAEKITASFWVKSNKTGTYCFHITKYDQTRLTFTKEYTINTANTWEQKVITIEPDSNVTASGGAIDNNNGAGFELNWQLMVGTNYDDATDGSWSTNANHLGTSNQVNWLDSTSNNFYLTGVQLEVGDKATPFEHRSYGEELSLCQRYFCIPTGDIMPTTNQSHTGGGTMQAQINFYWTNDNSYGSHFVFPVEMRTAPTITSYSTNLDTANQGTGKITAYGDSQTWKNLTANTTAYSSRGCTLSTGGSTTLTNDVAGFAGLCFASCTADAEL